MQASHDPYPNKTDRDKQWNTRSKGRTWTRRELKQWYAYFYEGLLDSPESLVGELLFMHPEQTIESWQITLDKRVLYSEDMWGERRGATMQDNMFDYLQQTFLGFINRYGFHPEDQAWIFRQIFGDTYDPNRLFPLLLPNEKDYRVIAYSAACVMRFVMFSVHDYLDGSSDNNYPCYIQSYMASTLAHLPLAIFGTQLCEDEMGYDGRVIASALRFTIHIAHQDLENATKKDKPRIQLARSVKALFDEYKGDLGEYPQLVAMVEEHGHGL